MLMQRPNGFRRRQHRWTVLAAGACWLLGPSAHAQAHTTFPGLGDFGSGFLHPLTTPPHLLILVALGLWLGQRRPLDLKGPAIVLAAGAAAGLLLTVAAHVGGVYPPVLSAVALCIGAGVAAAVPVPSWVRLGVCGVAALLLGMDSGVDAGTAPSSAVKMLSATWASLVLCVVNAAFYVSLLPVARPAQIGVRVAGSWIVAIALLLLAFALRR